MSEPVILMIVVFAVLIVSGFLLRPYLTKFLNRPVEKQANDVAKLRANGTRITAYVMNVNTVDHSVSDVGFFLDEVDGRSSILETRRFLSGASYRVVAQGMDPRTHKYFTFERIVDRDELPKNYTPGSDVSFEVSVWIDPKNPRHYYMELPPPSLL